MLTETGRVVAIEADGLWVETLKQSACAQCNAQKGCGQKLLASVSENMAHVKAVFSEKQTKSLHRIWAVGDEVVIGIEESAIVKGTLITYLVPLLLMVFVAILSSYSGISEFFVAMLSFIGLVAGGVLVSTYARKLAKSSEAQVVVVS